MPVTAQSPPTAVFDGECSFCAKSVQFILKHERNSQLKFAASQSKFGQEALSRFAGARPRFGSIVLIEQGKCYLKSTAVMRLGRYMRWPWSMSFLLALLPQGIRDGAYELFAKNRHRWFGKAASCWVPTPELRGRFYQ